MDMIDKIWIALIMILAIMAIVTSVIDMNCMSSERLNNTKFCQANHNYIYRNQTKIVNITEVKQNVSK